MDTKFITLTKTNWYELNVQSVLEKLQVQSDKGLSKKEVSQRQEKGGKNVLQPPKKVGLFQKILHQLKDVSVIVLLIAVALSFLLAIKEGEGFIEPIAILAVVIMNLILAITQEGKAEKALEALEKLSAPDCTVLREGVRQKIETDELVPGDIILLETGNVVPADARLLESTGFFSDESALTGESEPAEKDASAALSGDMPLGDQYNMVFSGCVVTGGRGMAVVTETGMNTQMGRIAGFLQEGKRTKTPLQVRLDQIGRTIVWIAIASAIFLLAMGLRSGAEFGNMIMIAIALAVAAVPETLSLIVTLTLTNGVQRMIKKNAIIRKLPAVETLGSASVICSDKTGTLTQNRMTVKQLWMCNGEAFADDAEFTQEQSRFLEIFSMAGNAVVETDENGNKTYIGNATEVGILRLLDEKGFSEIAAHDYPRVAEIPFSSDRKMMTVILKDEIKGGYAVLTKGALDRLPLCPESVAADMETAQRVHDKFAEKALRMIALAGKHVDKLPDNEHLEELEQDIKLMGLIGLIDPPRPEAAISIQEAHNAGIHTVMITGDHAATAEAIAKELGMMEEGKHVMTGARLAKMCEVELHDTVRNYTVYARVSPEDKIRIVKAWQANGEVVAMTGDGVNDAPALKAADIGVAMGKTGTEVAKSASDMILTDDNFSTIVAAIGEGRNVYRIVKMVIFFLLVCNFSEIIIMLFGQMAGWGMALTPVMLLLINLFGDGVPGISLAKEKSDPDLMNNKPIKKDESLFGGGLLTQILQQTVFCTVATLIAYYIGALDESGTVLPSDKTGQTMAFLVCGWSSIIHIFIVRTSTSKSVFRTSIRNNKSLAISATAMVIAFGLMAALPFGNIFGLTAISGFNWLVVAGLSFIPILMREIIRIIESILYCMVRNKSIPLQPDL
jgi:calcium-translocating P-type ATPase